MDLLCLRVSTIRNVVFTAISVPIRQGRIQTQSDSFDLIDEIRVAFTRDKAFLLLLH